MVVLELVQAFLDARREWFANPEAYQAAGRKLLACDKVEALAVFAELLRSPDDEVRCQILEAIAVLYRSEAVSVLLGRIGDESAIVRCVVCGCLHDIGDATAVPPLLERLRNDPDTQVRGTAAYALGRIGSPDVLPELHRTFLEDHAVDELGHTPSSIAREAMNEVLRSWVTRRIAGNPAKTLEEKTAAGRLRYTVTAEAIPFDSEGRIHHTDRYRHVPLSAYGFGTSSNLNLQTKLIAPFEIEAEFTGATCTISRVFIYHPVTPARDVDWAIHTLLDPAALGRV
jgi:hypothetical protein